MELRKEKTVGDRLSVGSQNYGYSERAKIRHRSYIDIIDITDIIESVNLRAIEKVLKPTLRKTEKLQNTNEVDDSQRHELHVTVLRRIAETVVAYMADCYCPECKSFDDELLKEDEPEKYQSHFSGFVKEGIEADDLADMYTKVHAAIRADPTAKLTEKKSPAEKRKWKTQKLTYDERQAALVQRLNAINGEGDE